MSVCPVSIKMSHEQMAGISGTNASPIQRCSAEEHLKKVEDKFDLGSSFLGKVRKEICKTLATKISENIKRKITPMPLFTHTPTVAEPTAHTTPPFTTQISDIAELDAFQRELSLALCNYIANSEKFNMMHASQLTDAVANTLGAELGIAIYRKLASLQENRPHLLKIALYDYINDEKIADNFFSRYLQNNKILSEIQLPSPTASPYISPNTQNSQQFLFRLANTQLLNPVIQSVTEQHKKSTYTGSASQSEDSYSDTPRGPTPAPAKKSWCSCLA